MPQARQARALALERFDLPLRLLAQILCGAHLTLAALAAREQSPVVQREVVTALAFILLARQVRNQLSDELASALPQAPQLVEHQRRVGGVGCTQASLERGQHPLHALGRRLLLLDEILEAVGLVLQAAVGLLQLGAVAEQRQHTMLVVGTAIRAEVEFEESELAQGVHEKLGGRPPLLIRRQ